MSNSSGMNNLLATAIATSEQLAEYFDLDAEMLQPVIDRYPMRITRHYLSLIRKPGDPIWRQCIPDPLELEDESGFSDPLSEEDLSPVPGLIHRYPDRVVFLVSSSCAVYCRFCLRKRQVGCGMSGKNSYWQDAVRYIAENRAIRDVILSGGDPLMLPDDELAEILTSLRKIPHLEIVRIGTRIPVTMPERVTTSLCRLLKKFHPLYINTHFNHPREISPESTAACAMLADAGIQLGNQTVLLRGVNDDPIIMKELMIGLLRIRVRPYYIHQMDLVRGTRHFRTPVNRGIEIMESIRGHVSGLATPYYVIDLPGGKGKVPILPDYARREGDRLLLRNYLGEVSEYSEK